MLDKKEIRVVYSSSKWVIKQQRQVTTSTMHLAQELLMTVQCNGNSRTFAKETRVLKIRSIVASHWKLTMINQEDHLMEANLLKTTWEVARELNGYHSAVIQHSKLIVKVEKFNKWYLMSILPIKKIIVLTYPLLFYATMNHFSIRLWHATKSGFYMTASNDRLSGWSKKKLQSTSQSQTCTQKRSWSLNPGETSTSEKYAQQISEMHWKLQCLQPALVNRKDQILFHNHAWLQVAQPTLQKLNELGYELLPHPPSSPDLLPSDYHFFKHLDNVLQGKCFHNQQEAENAFQSSLNSEACIFYPIGINKLISHWKNVLIVMVCLIKMCLSLVIII